MGLNPILLIGTPFACTPRRRHPLRDRVPLDPLGKEPVAQAEPFDPEPRAIHAARPQRTVEPTGPAAPDVALQPVEARLQPRAPLDRGVHQQFESLYLPLAHTSRRRRVRSRQGHRRALGRRRQHRQREGDGHERGERPRKVRGSHAVQQRDASVGTQAYRISRLAKASAAEGRDRTGSAWRCPALRAVISGRHQEGSASRGKILE